MWSIEAHHVFQAVTGGLVVLLGVLLAEHLHARRSRRERAEQAALRASHLLSQVAAGYLDPKTDRSQNSEWWNLRQELWERLAEVRTAARGFRGAERLRDATDDVLAQIGAADTILFFDQQLLPRYAALDLAGSDLRSAVDRVPDLKEDVERWRGRWGYDRLHNDYDR